MNMHDIDDYRWLVSSAGADFIRAASELMAAGDVVAATTRLRIDLSPRQTHLVIQQAQLRQRAKDKFTAAERMFFTDVGLQQATGEIVADYKSRRFSPGDQVIDLCCGIGGDLMSLARRGPAVGVDRDEVTLLYAEANCRALLVRCGSPDPADGSTAGLPAAPRRPSVGSCAGSGDPRTTAGDARTTARRDDATKLDIAATSLIHIDPDRRPQGKRTTNIASHEPSDAFLEKLIAHCRGGAIKLAPAADVPQHWHEACELEWISHRGECKQLVVWFGAIAREESRRTATMISGDGAVHTIIADEQEATHTPQVSPTIGKYVYEPDAAVIAARLVGKLANRHGLAATAAGIAYLTGDRLIDDRALTTFEVMDLLPLDVKKLKASLRQRNIGRLEVKKRGVDIEPAELRRKLKCAGDEQATLIVTPHGGKVIAILARRVDQCRGSLRDPQS